MTAYRVEIDCFVLSCSGADWLSDCPPRVWERTVKECDGDEGSAREELRYPGFGYFFKRIGEGGVSESAREFFGVDHVRLLVR